MTIFDGRWQTFLGQKRKPGPCGREKSGTDRATDPSILWRDVEEGHYSCAPMALLS